MRTVNQILDISKGILVKESDRRKISTAFDLLKKNRSKKEKQELLAILVDISKDLEQIGRFDLSESMREHCAKIFHRLDLIEPITNSVVLNTIAQFMDKNGKVEAAIEIAKRALSIDLQNENISRVVEDLLTLSTVTVHTNNFKDSDKYTTMAAKLSDRIDPPLKSASLRFLAWTLFDQGQIKKSISAIEEAISSVESLKDIAHKEQLVLNFIDYGLINERLGRFDHATTFFLRAIDTLDKQCFDQDEARVLGFAAVQAFKIYAEFLNRRGDIGRALTYAIRSLAVANKMGNEYEVGKLSLLVGDIFARAGDDASAEHSYRQAIKSFQKYKNDQGIGHVLIAISESLRRRKQIGQARRALLSARQYLKKVGDNKGLAKCLAALGNIISHGHRPLRAKRYYLEALKLCSKNDGLSTTCLGSLSWLELQFGTIEEGQKWIRKANRAARKHGSLTHMAKIWEIHARIESRKGCHDKAFRLAASSIFLNERIRGRIEYPNWRGSYREDKFLTYVQAIESALELDRLRYDRSQRWAKRAFVVSELAKAQLLRDRMATLLDRKVQRSVVQRVSVTKHIDEIGKHIRSLCGSVPSSNPTVLISMLQLRERIILFISRFGSDYFKYKKVEFPVVSTSRLVFRPSSEETDELIDPLDLTHHENVIELPEVQLPADWRWFSHIMWNEISEFISPDDLIVFSPHTYLHLLPWAALIINKTNGHKTQFLGSRYPFIILPCVSLLRWFLYEHPSSRRDSFKKKVLVIGLDLPGAEQEASNIAEILSDKYEVIEAHMITRDDFLRLAPLCSIVHFAGHGKFILKHPDHQGIKLSDGIMSFSDLLAKDFVFNDAELVVLSGCVTGLRGTDALDDYDSMINSLFAAGARTVIGSLWNVPDRETLLLMTEFYKGWVRDEKSIFVAFRDARNIIFHDRQHPYFWAGFQMWGKWW
jgi:tetratricopeptide (TPR) repeat protein